MAVIRRSLRLFLRAFFLAFLILLLVIVFGVPWFFKHVVGEDAVLGWISQATVKYANRQIRVREVQVGVLQGIKMFDFKVSEVPDFRAGTFAKGRGFIMRPNLWRLLWGEIEMKEIGLSDAELYLRRTASGIWNIDDLLRLGQGPRPLDLEPEEVFGFLPVDLEIHNLELDNCRLHLDDATNKLPHMEARHMGFSLNRFSVSRPFDIRFSAEALLHPPVVVASQTIVWDRLVGTQAQLAFKGRLNLAQGHWQDMVFRVDDLEAKTDLWSVRLEGEVKPNEDPWLQADIAGSFNQYKINVVKIPMQLHGAYSGRLEWLRQGKNPIFKGFLQAHDLDISWGIWVDKRQGRPFNFQFEGAKLAGAAGSAPPAPQVPQSLTAAGSAPQLSAPGAEISDLSSAPRAPRSSGEAANADPKPLWLGGHYRLQVGDAPFGGSPDWRLRLGPASSWRLEISSGTDYAHGALRIMPIFKDYRLSGGRVHWEKLAADVKGTDVDFKILRARLPNGFLKENGESIKSLNLGLSYFNYLKQGELEQYSFTSALEGEAVETQFLKARQLWITADLRGIQPKTAHAINGEVHAHLVEGGLFNIPQLVKRAPFMEFLIKPITILEDLNRWKVLKLQDHDFTTVPMDVMQADYYLDDGKMSLESVDIRGSLGNVTVRGYVDFPHDRINLVTTTSVPRSRARWKFSETFSDAKGNPYLNIKVKGNLSNPDVYTILPDRKEKPNWFVDDKRESLKAKIAKIFSDLFK